MPGHIVAASFTLQSWFQIQPFQKRCTAVAWSKQAKQINSSHSLSPPPAHSVSALHCLSLCLHSLCFIVTRHSKSWLEYQHDNFLTVPLYLSAIALIRWFSLSGFVLSWQRWPGRLSSSSLAHFVFPSIAVLLSSRPLCTHIALCTRKSPSA